MEISSHYRQLLRELNEQRQHGILCDACVIVDGKIFKAHKNVLLGSSRYFKTLYCQVKKGAEPHHQTTVTHLDIVTATGFKAILDFMYSAHLALTSKNVIEVMSAASYLQMTDIVQACHSFIKAALDISIRSEMADELADFEMGAVAAAGIGGGAGGAGGPLPALSIDTDILQCHPGFSSSHLLELQMPRRLHYATDPFAPFQALPELVVPLWGKEEMTHLWPQISGGARHMHCLLGPAQGMSALTPVSNIYSNTHYYHFPQTASSLLNNSAAKQRSVLVRNFEKVLIRAERRQSKVTWPKSMLRVCNQDWSWFEDGVNDFTVIRKKFKCPYCSFSAMHQCILKRHMRSHTGERPYPCEICGKKFTRREHMKRHTLQVHSKDKKYVCKVCSRVFMSAASVGIKHGSRRHGVCADCS
uniref:Zinc finger and BTB domain containing 46 n=1 Tax=Tetraodon nigroviridis TaxID=99883 RepID=H3DKJ0_TETNG